LLILLPTLESRGPELILLLIGDLTEAANALYSKKLASSTTASISGICLFNILLLGVCL